MCLFYKSESFNIKHNFHVIPFIVPTPLDGGRNYILKSVFCVQTILADRYIHRRELRLVSLESLSSEEIGINFFLFSFFTGSYRGLNFGEKRVNSVDFIHIFQNVWLETRQFCLNLLKFFMKMSLISFLKTKNIVGYFFLIFFQKLWLNISQSSDIFIENSKN